jgi:hypothetical protein
MIIKRLIVRLRMWYADIRGHHGKNDGIMNLATGTWGDIKRNDKKNK